MNLSTYIKIELQQRQPRATFDSGLCVRYSRQMRDQEKFRNLLQLLSESKGLAAVQPRVIVTSRPEIPNRLSFRAMSVLQLADIPVRLFDMGHRHYCAEL